MDLHSVPQQPWGLYICLKDQRETIPPVIMTIGGPHPRVVIPRSGHHKSYWGKEPAIIKQFDPYPIINVSDVETFPSEFFRHTDAQWDPRRYRATIGYADGLLKVPSKLEPIPAPTRCSKKTP